MVSASQVMLEMAIGTKSKKTKTASRSCWVRCEIYGEIHGETDQDLGFKSHLGYWMSRFSTRVDGKK